MPNYMHESRHHERLLPLTTLRTDHPFELRDFDRKAKSAALQSQSVCPYTVSNPPNLRHHSCWISCMAARGLKPMQADPTPQDLQSATVQFHRELCVLVRQDGSPTGRRSLDVRLLDGTRKSAGVQRVRGSLRGEQCRMCLADRTARDTGFQSLFHLIGFAHLHFVPHRPTMPVHIGLR